MNLHAPGVLLCAGLACGIPLSPTWGQQLAQPQPDGFAVTFPAPATLPFDEMVARLDADDLLERERATQRLATSRAYTFEQIEAALVNDELSLEQRHRLTRAARERFTQTPRAAMGVQFDQQMLRNRVVINKTFEPFASAGVLEEGDMIIEADGVSTVGQGARVLLRSVILAHAPGDRLPLTIRRGSEKLTLDLPLGHFGDLQNAQLDAADINRAWQMHAMFLSRKAAQARAEKGAAGTGDANARVITTGMKAVRALTQTEYQQLQEKRADAWDLQRDQMLKQAEIDRRSALRAGGSGRGGGVPEGDLPFVGGGNAVVVIKQNGQVINIAMPAGAGGGAFAWQGAAGLGGGVGGGGVWGDDPFNPDMSQPQPSPAEELTLLRNAFAARQTELENLDPRRIGPADPEMINRLRGQQLRDLRMIERQIKAIEAEISEAGAVSMMHVTTNLSSAVPIAQ